MTTPVLSQRGDIRQDTFSVADDCRACLSHVTESAPGTGQAVVACGLTTNLIHRTATPETATPCRRTLTAQIGCGMVLLVQNVCPAL